GRPHRQGVYHGAGPRRQRQRSPSAPGCGRLDSWRNLCTQRDGSSSRPEIHRPSRQGGPMSPPQLTPQQEALAQELLDALRQGTDDLLAQIARTLAATTDATLFGDTELKLRDIAHLIAPR